MLVALQNVCKIRKALKLGHAYIVYLAGSAFITIVDEVVGGSDIDGAVLFVAVVLLRRQTEPLLLMEVDHSSHSDDKVPDDQSHYFH